MRFGVTFALFFCGLLHWGPVFAAEQAISESAKAEPVKTEQGKTEHERTFVPQQMADLGKGKSPSIAASSGHLYVVYKNDDAIFFADSSDFGKSWTAPVKVSASTLNCTHAQVLAAPDGSINVVWQGKASKEKANGIFYTRSTDGGKTFNEPVDISGTKTESSEPQLAIGHDNSLHIVWIDTLPAPAGPDVFYSCSTDNGKTWSKIEDVSNTPGAISRSPGIAVGEDGRIHIVWSDTSSGDESPDVFYVWKKKGSDKWSAPEDISKDSGFSELPHVACGQNGRVYFIWTDSSNKFVGDILCVIENADGKFSKALNISDSNGVSSQPAMAVDADGISAVVWIDTTGNKNIPDLWMKVGNKETFSHKEKIWHSNDLTMYPSVSVLKGEAYVVWQETHASGSLIKGCKVKLK